MRELTPRTIQWISQPHLVPIRSSNAPDSWRGFELALVDNLAVRLASFIPYCREFVDACRAVGLRWPLQRDKNRDRGQVTT